MCVRSREQYGLFCFVSESFLTKYAMYLIIKLKHFLGNKNFILLPSSFVYDIVKLIAIIAEYLQNQTTNITAVYELFQKQIHIDIDSRLQCNISVIKHHNSSYSH